jgi:hypothetical protein
MRLSPERAMRSLKDLLAAEATEQATWRTAIPAWHPRNEDPPAAPPTPPANPPTPPADPPPADPPTDPPLGEGGQRALAAEREARRAAERRAAEAERELAAARGQNPPPTDPPPGDPPPRSNSNVAKLTATVRRANLKAALADHGITGQRAQAVSRLVHVDYDDEHEPVNLLTALEDAEARYGAEIVRGNGATPPASTVTPPPATDAGRRAASQPTNLTAEELGIAQMFGMTGEQYVQYKALHPDVGKADPVKAATQ